MPDSYDAVLARTTARRRIDPRMQALIADMMTPEGHPAGAPKPIVPPSQSIDGPGFFKEPKRAVVGSIRDAVNAHLAAQGHTPPGFLEEAYRALAGGLRDAAQQSVELVNTATHGIKERMQDTPFGRVGAPAAPAPEAPKLPDVADNETSTGRVARRMVGVTAGAAAGAGLGAMRNMLSATAVAGAPLGAVLYGTRDEARRAQEEERKRLEAQRQRAFQALEYGDQ